MATELSSGQLRSMVDCLAEGVVNLGSDGQILIANAAARRLLSLPAWTGGSERLWDSVHHSGLQEFVQQALTTHQPEVREFSLRQPEERTLQVQVVPSETDGGSGSVTLILQDVTELRRLERVRQDFVANVSHELRTPLTSIKGFIETLLHGALDEPAHNRRFLTLMEEDVNRLARLTEDLLELSKVESLGKPKTSQAVDLARILTGLLDTLKPQMDAKQITLVAPTDRADHHARGDPDQLRQVFWNLLDNAIKYNVEGGRIEVSLHADPQWLRVRVVDSGIGISTEELPRIFERFYRVDKARSRALGGTGLGLSIVKHIVEAHGGYVEVTSEPGRGSTFQVTLPRWTTTAS